MRSMDLDEEAQQKMSDHPTQEEQTQRVVADFIEAFSRGDAAGVEQALADDATWWIMGAVDGISGTQEKALFVQMFVELSKAFTTGAVSMKPLAWTIQGERAAVEAESYGELIAGGVYANKYHFLFTVRDGKIASVKEYSDTEHLRETFGAA